MGAWFLFENPLTTFRRFGIHWVDTLVICVYLKDGISPKALYKHCCLALGNFYYLTLIETSGFYIQKLS